MASSCPNHNDPYKKDRSRGLFCYTFPYQNGAEIPLQNRDIEGGLSPTRSNSSAIAPHEENEEKEAGGGQRESARTSLASSKKVTRERTEKRNSCIIYGRGMGYVVSALWGGGRMKSMAFLTVFQARLSSFLYCRTNEKCATGGRGYPPDVVVLRSALDE